MQLLRLLQSDSSRSTKELAAEVNLSTTPVYERVKQLERRGYIKKYVAILDAAKLNLGFSVFCNVKLRAHSYEAAQDFLDSVADIPEVAECYVVGGTSDYLLKVYAPDMAYFRDFVIERLGRISSIGSVTSLFVMKIAKHTTELPIKA